MKPSSGRSLQTCTAPSGERSPNSSQYWLERLTHLCSWADWSNESKVPCSKKQQQQQLTELGIEPGTLRSPGQCSNHRAVQTHKTVSVSLANALVEYSQIPTILLLADQLAEMKLGIQEQLLLPCHCRYQLNRSSL